MPKEMFELSLLRLYESHEKFKIDFEYVEDWIKAETEAFIIIGTGGLSFDLKGAKKRYSELHELAHRTKTD